MSADPRFTTRRKLLATSGSLSLLAAAGCLGDDDEAAGDDTADDGAPDDDTADDDTAGDDTETEATQSTVTLLVEGVGGHDHDHGLSEHDIDHACGHMEFDEQEDLSAGASEDDAPTISDTHQPFEVTIEGDSGYVVFEADDHDDDGTFAFFSDVAGTIEVVDGHLEYDTDDVPGCDDIEEYSVVELPDERAVLELAAAS